MTQGALLFPNGQPIEKSSFILFYLIICSFLYPIPTILVLIFYLCNEFALERDPTCFVYSGIYNLVLGTLAAIKFTGNLIFLGSDPEKEDLIVVYSVVYVVLISLHLWGIFLSLEFYKLVKNPTVDPRINPLIPHEYHRPAPYHNGGYQPYRPPLPSPNHGGGYEPYRPPQTGGTPFSGQNNLPPQTGGSPFSGQNNFPPQTGASPFSGQNNVAPQPPQTGASPFSGQNNFAPQTGGSPFSGQNNFPPQTGASPFSGQDNVAPQPPQTGASPFSGQNQNNDYAPNNGGTPFGGLN